eukprot:gene11204-12493_t
MLTCFDDFLAVAEAGGTEVFPVLPDHVTTSAQDLCLLSFANDRVSPMMMEDTEKREEGEKARSCRKRRLFQQFDLEEELAMLPEDLEERAVLGEEVNFRPPPGPKRMEYYHLKDYFAQDLDQKVPVKCVDGLTNIADRVSCEIDHYPDLIMVANRSEIHRHLTKQGSKVVIHSTIYGTALSDQVIYWCDERGEEKSVALPRRVHAKLLESAPTYLQIFSLGQQAELRLASYAMEFVGSFTIYLDNDHRIYRVEKEGNLKCKPYPVADAVGVHPVPLDASNKSPTTSPASI